MDLDGCFRKMQDWVSCDVNEVLLNYKGVGLKCLFVSFEYIPDSEKNYFHI